MNELLIDKMTQMFKAFRQKDAMLDGTLDIYLDRLSSLPFQNVCDAIDRLIDTSRFLPSIAEIKEAAVEGPFGADLADEAWAEVQKEARRVGFNRLPTFANGRFEPPPVPTFSTEIIAAAAYSVGWELICTGDDSKGFVRAQFVKAFHAFRERDTKAKQAGVVPMDGIALPNGVIAIDRKAS